MSLTPKKQWKRYDPPGKKKDEPEEKCPKCSFADWEKAVWAATLIVAFYIVVVTMGVAASRTHTTPTKMWCGNPEKHIPHTWGAPYAQKECRGKGSGGGIGGPPK